MMVMWLAILLFLLVQISVAIPIASEDGEENISNIIKAMKDIALPRLINKVNILTNTTCPGSCGPSKVWPNFIRTYLKTKPSYSHCLSNCYCRNMCQVMWRFLDKISSPYSYCINNCISFPDPYASKWIPNNLLLE